MGLPLADVRPQDPDRRAAVDRLVGGARRARDRGGARGRRRRHQAPAPPAAAVPAPSAPRARMAIRRFRRRGGRARWSCAPSARTTRRASDPARWRLRPMPPTSGPLRRDDPPPGRRRARAIEPWDDAMVQPASVDLRLGGSFRVFHNHRIAAIDLADPPTNLTELVTPADGDPFVIHPGEFVLGRTQESVEMPDDLVARIEGKALALDTPVPTPDGWRTIRDLRAGRLGLRTRRAGDPGDRRVGGHARPPVPRGAALRRHQRRGRRRSPLARAHARRLTAPAAHADDRPDRAERPPWQRLPVALGPMRAGSVRRARVADRPVRARRVDRRRNEHGRDHHLQRPAHPARDRDGRLPRAARERPDRIPDRRGGPLPRRPHRAVRAERLAEQRPQRASACSAKSGSRASTSRRA